MTLCVSTIESRPVRRGWKWPQETSAHDSKTSLLCSVTQSFPSLRDPMDCSPPGSSVRGIFQPGILERVAISFSRGSSPPRDQAPLSCTGRRVLNNCATCMSHKFKKFLGASPLAQWLRLSTSAAGECGLDSWSGSSACCEVWPKKKKIVLKKQKISLPHSLPNFCSLATLWTCHRFICFQNEIYKIYKLQSKDLGSVCCQHENEKCNLHEKSYFYFRVPPFVSWWLHILL